MAGKDDAELDGLDIDESVLEELADGKILENKIFGIPGAEGGGIQEQFGEFLNKL